MANAVYPKVKEGWLAKTGPDLDTDAIYVSLMDGYTYDATDATGADMATGTWIQCADNALASKTVTNGVFDAADITFTAVPAGAAVEALIIHTIPAADLTSVTTTTSTDLLTKTTHGLTNGDRVMVSNQTTTTSLNELTTIYYVVGVSGDNFQLSLTSGGAAVTIDATGTCDIHLMDSIVPIAYIDTGTGLPVTPNGSDITVTWDSGASKIFAL